LVPFRDVLTTGVRNGLYKSKEFHGRGANIVNMGELFGHPRLGAVPMKRIEVDASEQERFGLKKNDLIFARRSLTAEGAGKCSLVTEIDGPTVFESSIIRARPDPKRANALFLYYLWSSPLGMHLLDTIRRQVAVAGITGKDLEQLEVPMPELADQEAIARVLGSFDDKIEQNRRTGRALEGLARAVFKAWFVDFEPVKAKAAGATAFPGMPAAAFAALPDGFVDSELGRVPEGWNDALQRVADLEKRGWLLIGDGYRAKRTELADCGLPFIRAGNVNGTVNTQGAELLGEAAVAKAGVKRSKIWDTVFTSKGTVGRIGLVTPATGEVVYAPQVCFWRSTNAAAIDPFFLHLWMRSDSFTSQWMSVKGQTDMADFVSLSDQRAMEVVVPTPELQAAFGSIAEPLIRLQGQGDAESRKLADLRDYLLPRLLSGRVRVREAEVARAAGTLG
jgi:type I restriction enzyme, S subunit